MAENKGNFLALGPRYVQLCQDALAEIERRDFMLNACRGAALSQKNPFGDRVVRAVLEITAEYDLTGKLRT